MEEDSLIPMWMRVGYYLLPLGMVMAEVLMVPHPMHLELVVLWLWTWMILMVVMVGFEV